MKKLLGLLVISMIATSCSSIESATEKWKTPEAPNAGLSEGEKSNYLDNKAPEAAEKPAPKAKKKKAKKK